MPPGAVRPITFDYSESLKATDEVIDRFAATRVIAGPNTTATLVASTPTKIAAEPKKATTNVTIPAGANGSVWTLEITAISTLGQQVPLGIEIVASTE